MLAQLIAWPAYGRNYKSALDMRQDFLNGKDFSASKQGGPYFSIRDFSEPYMIDFSGVLLFQDYPEIQETVTRMEMKHAQ